MGKRESYEDGVFAWVDLATSDQDAAKTFYGALFGWDYDDRDGSGGSVYALATLEGQVAAGIAVAQDGPPRWNSYISVRSVDGATERAQDQGADVVVEPTDVGPAGRMAVLQDPTGAAVCVWDGNERIGARVVNQPGALCWNDLMTHDVEKAKGFYTAVFGWEVAPVEHAPNDRHAIRVGETLNGGISRIPEQMGTAVKPHWLAAFAVDDVERSLKTAEEHGGRAISPVIEVPSGRFAVIADPQGALLGLVDGDMDD